VNHCYFSGWIDSRVRYKPMENGDDAVSFHFNVSGPYKEKDGKWHMERFHATAYGDPARTLKYAVKGYFIDVEGFVKKIRIPQKATYHIKRGTGHTKHEFEYFIYLPQIRILRVNKCFNWKKGGIGP